MANPFDPYGMSGVSPFQEKQPIVMPRQQQSGKGGILPEIAKMALTVGLNMALPGVGSAAGSVLPSAAPAMMSAGTEWLASGATNPFLQSATGWLGGGI